MYNPIETDISFEYLQKIRAMALKARWAVIGGWGVFFQVKEEYNRAFGREYLRSRDIDVFIDAKHEEEFFNIIKGLGFKESSYNFRYELIYDREKKKIITELKAKEKDIFNLIYIFLDIFSNNKTKKLGSWVFPILSKAKIEDIRGYPVLEVNSLLNLKITSFFEREKLDKELKDACDIYALLFYSGKKPKLNLAVKKAAEKIINRQDLQEYIAENVLMDSLKAGFVSSALNRI